jgi:hypothetical protein
MRERALKRRLETIDTEKQRETWKIGKDSSDSPV